MTDPVDTNGPEETRGESTLVRYYYVDEAGDSNLFNRRKEVVVGREGCSNFFSLGLLDIADPDALDAELTQLRKDLLADPYLENVPSMDPARRKTALAFHAKDDCPEVRREVFRLLVKHDVRFFAVVRDKRVIVEKVRDHNAKKPDYRYHPNQLYDRCVSRLFKDRLHKDGGYAIHFSLRGSKPRTASLKSALEQARNNFRRSHGVESTAPIELIPATPRELAGLQAVDYFLWALQRVYERREDRYWEYVADKASLVHDVDDTREADYGTYYTKKSPLNAGRLKEEPGI